MRAGGADQARADHLRRDHLQLDDVHSQRARTVQVAPVDPAARIPIELDGETPGYLPATFDVLPSVLPLRF